jgi:hypothetical protein
LAAFGGHLGFFEFGHHRLVAEVEEHPTHQEEPSAAEEERGDVEGGLLHQELQPLHRLQVEGLRHRLHDLAGEGVDQLVGGRGVGSLVHDQQGIDVVGGNHLQDITTVEERRTQ